MVYHLLISKYLGYTLLIVILLFLIFVYAVAMYSTIIYSLLDEKTAKKYYFLTYIGINGEHNINDQLLAVPFGMIFWIVSIWAILLILSA